MKKFLRLGLPVIVLGMALVGWDRDDGMPKGFVWVEGGTFTMGSPEEEPGRGFWGTIETQHEVTLTKGFYMSKYPVTQKEWEEVMGNNPSFFKGDNLPVGNITWYSAVEYCNKRSAKEGLTPAYTIDKTNKDPNNTRLDSDDAFRWTVTLNRGANGCRLPTEAEWEYAARGGTEWNNPYYIYAGSNDADEVAWYKENSGGKMHPVGTKAPNALGIYDMSGNVFEWCADWFSGGDYPAGAQTDPTGASSGSRRVVRGGSWSTSLGVRSADRSFAWPSLRNSLLGFRLVRP